MERKHHVLGFIFNEDKTKVLLMLKNKPEWQKGRWNGIGGKVEETDSSPLQTMLREFDEEVDGDFIFVTHCITLVCPGGTVFIYKFITKYPEKIIAKETEPVSVFSAKKLNSKVMSNLRWIIPILISSLVFPIMLTSDRLGCDS